MDQELTNRFRSITFAPMPSDRGDAFRRWRFSQMVKLIDFDLMRDFIAYKLSHREFYQDIVERPKSLGVMKNRVGSDRERVKLEHQIKASPILMDAFTIIAQIIHDCYFEVFQQNTGLKPRYEYSRVIYNPSKAKDPYAEHEKSSLILAESMVRQAVKGEILDELLPFLLKREQAILKEHNASLFAQALNRAIKIDRCVFEAEQKCPFGRRISSIFAFQPLRKNDEKVIILQQKKPGSLPAFICDELVTFGFHHHPASAPRPPASLEFHRG
ncbi:MAG: hypothetical protein AAF988_08925 [Pseudomonadota bacterium]